MGIYVRYLPEELGAQVRDLASDADLETLYTAAKLTAAREAASVLIRYYGTPGAPRELTGM